jgi:hypothetical protein
LEAYPHDSIDQLNILTAIVGTTGNLGLSQERFNKVPVHDLMLSKLKSLYEKKDVKRAVDLLSTRHKVRIDQDLCLLLGTASKALTLIDESMIDYHLTVANCIGLGFRV